MNGIKRRLIGLCLPPIVFCIIDGALTLFGQSSAYWAGMRHTANELSPTFHQLLVVHPWAAVAGFLGWMAIFVGVILLLPGMLALSTSIAVTMAHTAGACSWLLFRFQFGYQICNALLLLSALALGGGICWGWKAQPSDEDRLPLAPFWRWLLIAALVAAAVYLFIWPRTP
jgi:hypothetical protein